MEVVVELGLVLLDIFDLERGRLAQQRCQPSHPTNKPNKLSIMEAKR